MSPAMRASDNLLSRWLVCSLLPWGLPWLIRLVVMVLVLLLLLTVYHNIPAPWATYRVVWRYTIGYLELLATGMTGKPSPRGTTPPIHTTGSSHSSIFPCDGAQARIHPSILCCGVPWHAPLTKNEERTNIIIEEEEKKKRCIINVCEIMMNVQP